MNNAAPKTSKKRIILRHSHVVILEIVAVMVVLLALAGAAAVWRLQSGPVNVGFAKNYIQEALRVPERGLTPVIGDAALSWPDLSGPVLLGVRKVKLYNAEGQAVLALEEAELSLSRRMLLLGQISPVGLILKEPVVRVVRAADGRLDFGILGLKSEKAPDDEASAENRRVYGEILKYVARPDQQKTHKGLGNLEALIVRNASLMIKDEQSKSAWILPRFDATLESGHDALMADMTLGFSAAHNTADPQLESFLKLHFEMPWTASEGRLKGELKNFDPWFFLQQIPALADVKKGDTLVDAQLAATTDKDLKPVKALLAVTSPQGAFAASEISAEPLVYKNLVLEADYNAAENKIQITRGRAEIKDIALNASGSATISGDTLDGAVRVGIPQIAHSRIAEFWPPALKGDNAEEWILRKLSKGTLSDLYAEMKIKGQKTDTGWSFSQNDIIAGFSFENMSANYRPPLLPVTNAKGKGIFNVTTEVLAIDIESGKIGDMNIKPSHLEFKNIIQKGKGIADLKIKIEGPLKSGLEYIALEPIGKKLRFAPATVKGSADLAVDVTFPTRKDVKKEEVKVAVIGTLNDLLLPAVVKDLPLTGGPFALSVTDEKLHVAGKGFLASSAGTFDYTDMLKAKPGETSETIKAIIDTDPDTRLRMGIDLSDFIDSNLPVDVSYTEDAGGAGIAVIKADLAPAHVYFDPFDYDKKPGEGAGQADLKVKIVKGDVKDITDLSVTAPGLSLSNASLSFRQKKDETELAKGNLPAFTIGDTKASASFTVDEAGRYKINTKASFFDLAPFLDNEDKTMPDDPAMEIELTARGMRGDNKISLQDARFLIDMDAAGRTRKLEVTAQIGKGSVSVNFAPDETGSHRFSMDTDDAGATLAAFGIYKNIRGGTMKIRGKPIKGPADPDMHGQAEITNFKVVNAPTLAKLISAMSLPGLAALLGNEGLAFEKLEAGYQWIYKPLGSKLAIKDGRTSGNSVGFTFEGAIDQSDNTMDINGTMVPLSGINKVIGTIPLVGDILTGGNGGGLVAATYTVKGKTEEPSVMVNPLSVLTPGILRRILFE